MCYTVGKSDRRCAMFEKKYSDCMLQIRGYETYYNNGDGYSYNVDKAISVSSGAELESSGAKVKILKCGFSRIKVKITYKDKSTVHDMKKGDSILLESYDRSHGSNEFACIDQKELSVRLEQK